MKLTKRNAEALAYLNSIKSRDMQAVSGNAKNNSIHWYDRDTKSCQKGKKSKAK